MVLQFLKSSSAFAVFIVGMLSPAVVAAQADLQALGVTMGIPDGDPRGQHPSSFSATVINNGPDTAQGNQRWDIYLSTDSTITTSDQKIGDITTSFTIPSGSGGTWESSSNGLSYVTIPADMAAGTYYVGTIIVPQSGHTTDPDTSNNDVSGNTVVITFPQADLQALAVTMGIPDGDPRGEHPSSFSATFTNNGPNTAEGDQRWDIYLSTDSTITTSDQKIGDITTSFTVPSGSGGTWESSSNGLSYVTIPADMAAGTYYVGTIIVPQSGHTTDPDTSNNDVSGNTVVIPSNEAQADLQALAVTMGIPDGDPRGEHPSSFSATFTNNGPNTAEGDQRWDIYLSTDSTITTSDQKIGDITTSFTVPSGSGGTWESSSNGLSYVTIPADMAAGTYYVGTIIVPQSGHTTDPDTSNNDVSGNTVVIPSNEAQADLQALAVTMGIPDGDPRGEHPSSFNATVRNNGPATSSGNYEYEVALSTDSTITTDDLKIGDITIPHAIDSGETYNWSATSNGLSYVTIPADMAAGTYYVGTIIVPLSGATPDPDSSNNNIAGNTVEIPEPAAIWLHGAALLSLAHLRRRWRRRAHEEVSALS